MAKLASNIWRLGRPRFTIGAVGVVLDDDSRVLLVEHVFHPKVPWGLPGGWVDRSEDLETSVIREFQEELALKVSVERVLLVEISEAFPSHIDVVYLCQKHGAVGNHSRELLGYDWVSFDA
ncbi:MAG: NUDIX hydrolase, partial [Chloroflexota bacterium]